MLRITVSPEVEAPVAAEPPETRSAKGVRVDGFGGNIGHHGTVQIAADLSALGLPAESDGIIRRSDSGVDPQGWISLIADAETWAKVLLAIGVINGGATAMAKVEEMRQGLIAALGGPGPFLANVVVPFLGEDSWGADLSISLAPGVFQDGLALWYDRVAGVERAPGELRSSDHFPLGHVQCLISGKGFRLRWKDRKGFAQRECDYSGDGTRRGVVREGGHNPRNSRRARRTCRQTPFAIASAERVKVDETAEGKVQCERVGNGDVAGVCAGVPGLPRHVGG